MKVCQIPSFIRDAGILSDDEIKLLARVDRLPTAEEIDAFRYDPQVQELMNAFIGDSSSRLTHQLITAREFLRLGQTSNAWKIMLL